MRFPLIVASVLAVSAAPHVACAAPIAYPATERGTVSDTVFGQTVADPYRWLENDVRTDPRVADWVARENQVTQAYLATLPGRDAIKARLTKLWNYERFGVPEVRAGRFFYTHNSGLQNQAVLFMRAGPDGAPRMLIDPNTWAKDGATALAEWAPSDDGRRIVYAVQDGGTDWRTIHVLDVETGQMLADEVKWSKNTGAAWASDGSGFYYTRYPAPAPGATYQAVSLNAAVWFHKVGTAQGDDTLIYSTPGRPTLGHYAQPTEDGRWLVISTYEGTDPKNDVTLVDLTKPGARPRPLFTGLKNAWTVAGSEGSRFWFVTDDGAPRQRIVTLDVATEARPVTVVAEDQATLDRAGLVGGRLAALYLVDARSEARLYARDGKPLGKVALPGIGTIGGFDGRDADSHAYFSFSSFNVPASIYRLDMTDGGTTAFASPKVAFDPADYVVEQRFYASRDGTRIPLFLIHKKGLDLSKGAPTILYGYGGFNISLTPAFSPGTLAWVQMGGVYAQASLRGGGEYGNAWHDSGRLANKQNVFDDFIAAGEYLKKEGIASALVARGGSNGGLLVGAVVNQRPDLWAAALPAVGVMDMLRFDRFTAGRYWVDDYGHPDKEADWKVLRAYSPYHNIGSGTAYPPVLVTTADTDDRVVPGHSFKYAAALQAADAGDKPHLIRIETRAGHGSGKPTDKAIAETADLWAFAAHWAGLKAE